MVIGITGGVGCGKSTVLNILEKQFGCHIIEADKVGHKVMEPGQEAFKKILAEFGPDILDETGAIHRKILGDIVFHDNAKLMRLNQIVHPAVKQYIKNYIAEVQSFDRNAVIVVEAALLIEDRYGEICDTLWYVYADKNVRFQRLKSSRGYTEEKTLSIMSHQLSEEDFTKNCDVKIDNSFDLENTLEQIKSYF